jgi:hypothetical protein
VIVDRGHPFEASRRALCGGLTEIKQRRVGRAVITSGVVSHLVPPAPAAPPPDAAPPSDGRAAVPLVAAHAAGGDNA